MAESFGGTNLHIGDICVIVAYFAFVLFVGLWTSRQNRGSAGGYFLAGRNMNWIPVGASLFASNIGSLHFVGLAGSGAASGIAIGIYELNATYILIILAYIFLPVYLASGVYTMPQYLQQRYGGVRIQIFLAVLSLLMSIFTKISADLYSGAIFIEQSLNWDIYGAISLLLGVAAVFTVSGGLTAVIWTDFIQTIIMLVGAFVLMIISFQEVGGFNAMVEKFPQAISNSTLYGNDTCGIPRGDYMNLFRDASSGDLPWPGIAGLMINSVWYWCSDQVIVQRALAARSYTHAKAGTLLCGFIKLLPMFLLVFPGMIARILFTETVGCSDPDTCMEVCGSSTGCSNIAYPTLVLNLLPAGARGMMIAVMLAALMSSLTSIFNSSSTIFAMDVWIHIRKKASELEIMIVGRVFVIVLVVISIVWIPVIKASQGSQLFVYIQEISSFLQPPLCAVFVLGLFWPRLNEKGAFSALVVGFITGIIRFAIQYSYQSPPCGSEEPDPTPAIVKDFHYLYFAIFLWALTTVVAVVATLLTKPVDERCIQRLTWPTRHSKEPRLDIDKWLAGRSDRKLNVRTNGTRDDSELKEMKTNRDADPENSRATDLEDDHRVHIPRVKSSVPRRALNWICGIDDANKNQLSEHQIEFQDMLSIEETPGLQRLTALMAALLAVLTAFVCGFFA
ncbi:sodium/glucose cotransporter 5 [Aplysia californica]|uniref:Sodium/glucose cotransporter 5 n=1 Tax=Aplysia californica TaxID=6500 RepID=A0ABM1W180_APLCA|nr:sodium/glucose cotransporter 5 [Aplysia californica]